ncbi:hypothetical protein INR49_014395, partial [Caranx melampygus]
MTSKLKVGKVGSKNKEDAPYELESQFVLRLPSEYASTVRRIAQSSSMNMKDRLTIELHPDGRHGIVRVDRVPLACKLVDLPCMIESLKTVDKKTFYKTADVCQMLVCTLDGDLYPPLEEPTGTDPKSKKKDKDKDKKFVWNHGITCPLKNTRKRRFRKTAKKKVFGISIFPWRPHPHPHPHFPSFSLASRWEVIAEDESKETDQHGSLANLDSSPGTSGHKIGHGSSVQRDELREIFNDISSSSEDEEDEGDRHEDEDLNIMDTEDDLVRQLHDKLNESDSAQHESDRNSQIVMEYQVQINSIKAKLQDTRARKKQQEELIMKVENQALKNRFQALLDEIIQQEEREMEQMFKMEVWETLLTSMRVGEVAEFWCDAVHTGLYAIVSKGMRLIAQGKDPLEGQRHTCGMGNLFHYHSTGFPELDEIMRTPQPLIFIMELLQVGDPMSYHRESWMMEKDEKMQTVPILHMQGNELVKRRDFREAASKYKEAVLLLKAVQSREMPGDIDYINLGRMIIPLELNYCQCMLELEEYYEVIEHTTELLEKHKDCVKGYYKRAKAHAAVWNEKEARRDFNMVVNLDVTLASLVQRELRNLSERLKAKYWEEKEQYWNMLETKENQEEEEGHDDEEEEEEEEKREDKGKQEDKDNESVTRERKDEAGEEKGKEEFPSKDEPGGGKEDTVKVTPAEEAGNKEEASSSEINPDALRTEEKDWQQMLRLVMLLQNEGNFLIKENHFEEASAKFKEAIEYVDILQNKVDEQSDDWDSLLKVSLPLTLNLSQCMLELQQYEQVVVLTTKLLKKHKGNFKAVYQRALAHAALCNEEKAKRDFAMVEKLDPKFKPFVRQELKKLGERVRTMHSSQNKTYRDATLEKWGPVEPRPRELQRRRVICMRVSRRVLCCRSTRASARSSSSCCPPAVGEPGPHSPASVSMGTDAASSCFHLSRLYSPCSTLRTQSGGQMEGKQPVLVLQAGQGALELLLVLVLQVSQQHVLSARFLATRSYPPEALDRTLFANVAFGLVLGRLRSGHTVEDRQPNHRLGLQAHPLQEVRHLNGRFPWGLGREATDAWLHIAAPEGGDFTQLAGDLDGFVEQHAE